MNQNRFIVKGNINDVCNNLSSAFTYCKIFLGIHTVGELMERLKLEKSMKEQKHA
ncbi:MAG: hypothetical protein ACI4TT_03810 [Christensenellales bacterium]